MRPPLRERLRRPGALVADGAWGTLLMERGLEPGLPPESFNLTRPEVLREIAERYLEAGAEILTANTFGASPLKLEAYGWADRTESINRAAVLALREVAGQRAWVAGSVGPTGRLLEPYGDVSEARVREAFRRQVAALAAAGAELILVETMTDLREAVAAVLASRAAAPDLPVVASMTFDPTPRGFHTVMGNDVAAAVRGLTEAGADAVGSNCGHGSETMEQVARELLKHSTLPVIIQSNAGLPVRSEGRIVYPETPDAMARRIGRMVDAGVSIVGGCCGTTPEHVRMIRRRVGIVPPTPVQADREEER